MDINIKSSKLLFSEINDSIVLLTNLCLLIVKSPAEKWGLFKNKYSPINMSIIESPKNSSLS